MEIIFNNVSFTLFSEKIIDNLSFKIDKGKMVFINGLNAEMFLALINKDILPFGGDVFCECKKIAFLRKNPEDYFFCNTIYEEILFEIKKNKIRCDYDKKIVNALNMVSLDESYLSKSPFKISKGEQKLVAIASLLATNPRILILEDPFLSLDSFYRSKLIKLFRMMKLRYGKTFVIFTDDSEAMLELADKVICIKKGKLSFDGDKFEILTNDKLLRENGLRKPKIISFSDLIKEKKNLNIGYRDDINDLIKDIYRFVK